MAHHPKPEVLLHNFLNNPASLFEHKIFTALGLFMRNLTEQFHDYRDRGYHSFQDHFFPGINTSVHFVDEETEHVQIDDLHLDILQSSSSALVPEWALLVGRILVTLVCLLVATWVVNKRLRSRPVQYVVELLTCHLIILPMLPFIASFYVGIGLCHFGIWVFIQLFRRGRWHLVRPEDGFWAHEQYASSSASTALYMIEGKCDPGKIRKKVRQVILSPIAVERMSRRLRTFCGFPIWETVDMTKFNVRDHVRVAKWPKHDKRSKEHVKPWSETDVLDFLTTFQDKPLSSKRPAWEVVIIPNVRVATSQDPHYACIFRIHHAMMDGISSANILHQVLADKSFKFTMDPIETNAKNKPGLFVTLCMYAMALFLLPRTGLVNGFLNLDNKHNKYFAPGPTLIGPKHFSWTRPVRMEALKKIKERSRSSVMTVLLSSLGGSFRTMEERQGKGKKRKIPEFYHALTPVAMLPYPDRKPRNGFSGVVLPVAVGQYETPGERLKATHKQFKKENNGMMEVLGNFILISMTGVMPVLLQKLFGSLVHYRMTVSNIPGSEEEIRIFGGDKIVDMGAWLPCKYTFGMAMGLFSYGGRCRATMVGDQAYLSKSDLTVLIQQFETEISTLGASLGMTEEEIFC